jgi:hypothetical protein
MLRTLFKIGVIAVLGLIALQVVVGLLGPLVALLFTLLLFALKVGVIALVVYLVIRLISPETGAKIEGWWRR